MFTAFKKLLYVDQKQQRAKNAPPAGNLTWTGNKVNCTFPTVV